MSIQGKNHPSQRTPRVESIAAGSGKNLKKFSYTALQASLQPGEIFMSLAIHRAPLFDARPWTTRSNFEQLV